MGQRPDGDLIEAMYDEHKFPDGAVQRLEAR